MDRREYKANRISGNIFRFNKGYFSKQINKVIVVMVILLVILIMKAINHRTTNNIINIIEKNIYYDFSIKEDGKKAMDYLGKIIGGSKKSIEKLLAEQLNKNDK